MIPSAPPPHSAPSAPPALPDGFPPHMVLPNHPGFVPSPPYEPPIHTQQPQDAPPYVPMQQGAYPPPLPGSYHQHQMSTISLQPGIIQQPTLRWAPARPPMDGVSAGMENLVGLDFLVVDQLHELAEMLMGVEMRNRYAINDTHGNTVLFAYEESDIYSRQYFGPFRAFTMHIIDSSQREVIRLVRPNSYCCHGGCCRCCYEPDQTLHSITVEAPPGNKVGSVKEVRALCAGVVSLRDAKGADQLKATGPGCWGRCCKCESRKFTLEGVNGESVGCIERRWMGQARESITDCSQFELKFPKDLSSDMKAVVIGATMLMHYMYFERQPTYNRGQRR